MFILLLFLPVLCSSYYQCFYARIRFKCGKDEYWGPVVVTVYDERSIIYGGDKKQFTKDQYINIGEYKGLPEDPEKGVFKEWVDNFKYTFVNKNHASNPIFEVARVGLPFTTCRRIPAINNWTEIPIQLHAEDDC
ncbi:hypothetical protein PRIPAC_75329 [Pristionchus pacificus]|uniref:Uncharacterized protein n=1 Tax=Pristionchus pacificus TaxID=54126 RepID=A0A2A6BFN3_PRIPA|nr:hypothetical protein PRIPAC_75329 [Pristionchus pacificus]|eukprot:PDM64692.1 hypothetical protein PRIPAC_52948 [Pristionchus pacificus]